MMWPASATVGQCESIYKRTDLKHEDETEDDLDAGFHKARSVSTDLQSLAAALDHGALLGSCVCDMAVI